MFWIEGLITIPKFVAKKRLSLELQQLIFCGCQNQVYCWISYFEGGRNLQKLHTSSIKQFPSILWHTSVAELNWRFSTSKIWFFFVENFKYNNLYWLQIIGDFFSTKRKTIMSGKTLVSIKFLALPKMTCCSILPNSHSTKKILQ